MSERTQEQLKNLANLKNKIANTPTMEECEDHHIYTKEYNVLIAPSNIAKEQKTAGGIILTADTVDNENDRVQIGRLVAVSPAAFTYTDKGQWGPDHYPQVGDVIVYARFAGSIQIGLDGTLYRICKDADVMAVYDEAMVNKLMTGEE